MRKLAAIVFSLLAFAAPCALADVVSAPDYGFSADFPVTPQITPPAPSEKDADGKTISMATIYNGGVQGSYVSIVTVDVFNGPTKINVSASLDQERDNFVKPFSAQITQSHTGTLQGSPANFFTFSTPDGSIQGRGMIVILDQPTPRIYIVTMAYRAGTPQATIDALNLFIDSFKLT
jgi:hypothetical protein